MLRQPVRAVVWTAITSNNVNLPTSPIRDALLMISLKSMQFRHPLSLHRELDMNGCAVDGGAASILSLEHEYQRYSWSMWSMSIWSMPNSKHEKELRATINSVQIREKQKNSAAKELTEQAEQDVEQDQ